jgi:hypothetical protein
LYLPISKKKNLLYLPTQQQEMQSETSRARGGTQLIRDYSALHGEEIKKTPELLGMKNGRNWRTPRV